jgi:hypothetical protein
MNGHSTSGPPLLQQGVAGKGSTESAYEVLSCSLSWELG